MLSNFSIPICFTDYKYFKNKKQNKAKKPPQKIGNRYKPKELLLKLGKMPVCSALQNTASRIAGFLNVEGG